MSDYSEESDDVWELGNEPGNTEERTAISDDRLRVRINADFSGNNEDSDVAVCGVYINGEYQKIGTEHKLRFRLDHFTGCRFGLFIMSEKMPGGSAGFSEFIYQ